MRESTPIQTTIEESLDEVPVFPLPRIVFYPNTLLPLHLFEPRYRAMAEHCLTVGPRLIAIVQLAPGWEPDYEGQPALRPVAGLGRIIADERRPDGTFDILLQGLARVRLEELPLARGGFRLAKVDILEDRRADEVTPADLLALQACATSVAARVRRRHPTFELGITPEMSASRMLDLITDRLVAHPDTRQAILEAIDLPERIALVLDSVSELLRSLDGEQSEPS